MDRRTSRAPTAARIFSICVAGFDFTLADHLTGRLSGTYRSQEGYVNVYSYGCVNPSSGVPPGSGGLKCEQYSLGDAGYTGLRGLLRYNPTTNLDVLFSADYIHDEHNNGAEVLLYGNNPNPNTYAPNGGAGIPLTSGFICGKWCNYTTLGQQGGTFIAGSPLESTSRCSRVPALSSTPLTPMTSRSTPTWASRTR